MAAASVDDMASTLASIHTESGASLLALAEASPVLLVFLRHFGCPFCRKTISDVAGLQQELADRGVRPVFVHLSRQHPLWSTLNPVVFWAWVKRALMKHGIGMIQGDGHQMPGIFFLKGPNIVRRFVHRYISDEPDYLSLIQ
jgi:thiol-disulfide isomerase/thioredoxin